MKIIKKAQNSVLNVNIVGTPTVNNFVMSNFSSSNYAVLPVNGRVNDSEYVVKFQTGTISTEQSILHSEHWLSLCIQSNYLKTWNWQSSGYKNIMSISSNTIYWVKVICSGTSRSFYVSTDGSTYTLQLSDTDNTVTSTISENYPFRFGLFSHDTSAPFLGSIYSEDTYIKVNNNTIWQGVIPGSYKYYYIKDISVTNGDAIIKYYGISSNILYQPKLDGSEAITTMSGQRTPTIVNNTFTGYTSSGKGGSGYLSEGWDNTGLWQLTFKGRILDYTGDGLLLVCNSTQRDYNLINMTAEDHWRYNGSSSTKFSYSPSLYNSTMRNVTITKINSTTITIKVDTGSEVTIDGFTALSQASRCYIGVDSWENGKYGIISDILVIKK